MLQLWLEFCSEKNLLPPWAGEMPGGGGGVELGWGNGTSCWVLSFRQTNLTE